ncbi:MAG: hypothetical protein J0I06_05045 [Planctomycetes bacterium]|nr:hypothetical protein [Planctomycetota bacterium]
MNFWPTIGWNPGPANRTVGKWPKSLVRKVKSLRCGDRYQLNASQLGLPHSARVNEKQGKNSSD